MSLEAAIQANTAAVQELIAVMRGKEIGKPALADNGEPATGKPAKAPAAKAAPSKPAPAPATDEVNYAELRQKCKVKILEIAKTSRDDAVKVLQSAQAGASKLPDVTDENLAKLLELATKALAQ